MDANVPVSLFLFCFSTRCLFTTVDPETGVISRKEPLETLKK